MEKRQRAVALLLAGLATSGCAERIGKNAAAGAVKELKTQQGNAANPQVARIASQRAVEGALAALDTPEQKERIRQLVALAVAEAARDAVKHSSRRLVHELGAEGDGPLANSLARTSERLTQAAVGGARAGLDDIVPGCSGPDALDCIERRLQSMAKSTGAGFSMGVRQSIGWPLVLIAFAAGAAAGVLGAWLWSLRSLRRTLHESTA